ncbi:AAA family ATPase [Halobaculum magnesiiphilum]|uniref:ATP-binding protein n=1 Tax=Halobaculum magnesiiphilum TaxID=1017351 RepID=A0A8T8WB71_9EURY|nr:ATP-binding protein [Halobaculum magnesiiphilum]QZP37061.1 ATP-binding protein [Halobaculum magnesiiphilum]
MDFNRQQGMDLVEWGLGGYKSIVEYHDFSLDSLNVVVGKNNSGKSNILSSLIDYETLTGAGVLSNSWKMSRVSGKKFDQKLRIYARFRLTDEELKTVYERIRDREPVSESEIDRWQENDYLRFIYHHRNLGPSGVAGADLYTANFGDRRIPIYFTNINDSIRTVLLYSLPDDDELVFRSASTGGGVWSCVSDIIEKSVQSWKAVGAFRNPDDSKEVLNTVDLETDGDNLTQVLHTLRDRPDDHFQEIAETYYEVMEGVENIRTPLRGNRNTTVAMDEVGFSEGFDFEEISAGSKQILTLITQIVLAKEDTDLLLIEEPELHLHPSAERKIFNLIQDVVTQENGPQVIISTHSEVFVDLSKANSIVRVDRDQETGRTSIQGIGDREVDDVLIDLGYEKSELFQSSVVVFVEGRSDQRILEEFSKTLADTSERYSSFDELGVTLHPLGGSRLRKHGAELSHIVGRLRIPYRFVVDSDDQDPEEKEEELEEILETPKIYALNEYCIESYLLKAPEAISDAFRYDLSEVERYIEDSESRPNKKEVLKDLYQEFEDAPVSYDEETHGAMIARHMDEVEIDSELKRLIREIQELASN